VAQAHLSRIVLMLLAMFPKNSSADNSYGSPRRGNYETMIDAVRRDYLIAKALAYCVAAMERLPFYQRELSDQNDMQTLFDTIIIPEADREQLSREARERFLPEG